MNNTELHADLKAQHEEWLRGTLGPGRNSRHGVTQATLGERKRRRNIRRGLRRFTATFWQDPMQASRQIRGVRKVSAQQCMTFELNQQAVGSI